MASSCISKRTSRNDLLKEVIVAHIRGLLARPPRGGEDVVTAATLLLVLDKYYGSPR